MIHRISGSTLRCCNVVQHKSELMYGHAIQDAEIECNARYLISCSQNMSIHRIHARVPNIQLKPCRWFHHYWPHKRDQARSSRTNEINGFSCSWPCLGGLFIVFEKIPDGWVWWLASNAGTQWNHLGVSTNWGYPQIFHSNGIFPHKLSILGYPHVQKVLATNFWRWSAGTPGRPSCATPGGCWCWTSSRISLLDSPPCSTPMVVPSLGAWGDGQRRCGFREGMPVIWRFELGKWT